MREAVRSFLLNDNFSRAAALTNYGFLALIPLLLLVVFVLGLFVESSSAVLEMVRRLAQGVSPALGAGIVEDLQAVARQKAWGAVSVLILLWSVTPLMGSLRRAMVQIFKAKPPLHAVLAKLFDFAAALLLLLLFLALAASKLVPALKISGPASALRPLLFILLTTAALALCYRAFSPVRLRASDLFVGALAAALMLAALRPLFGLILRFNPNYGYAFGSLKAIFLLMIWVYYTFTVVLLGAEIIATRRRRDALLLRRVFLAPNGPAHVQNRLLDRFVHTHREGAVLFREGESGREMYYVLQGAVALTRAGQPLAEMKPGDWFGEMSMLNRAPRSATAIVSAPGTRLVAIGQDNFNLILRENPGIVQGLLREMARRLQITDEQLVPPAPAD